MSVLSGPSRVATAMPIAFPPSGHWLLKVLGANGQFVFGMYRRHMKAIGYLGQIDKLFGRRRRRGIGTPSRRSCGS